MNDKMPVNQLSSVCALFEQKSKQIEEWFEAEFAKQQPPFYASIDIRASNHKIAPIDVNLFPGGFNNLDDASLTRGASHAQHALQHLMPARGRLLVVAESHTRNQFYAQHLATLGKMLTEAGAQVRFATLGSSPIPLEAAGASILIEPLQRKGNRVAIPGFEPDAVLLNNDMSAGTPELLRDLEQPQLPPLAAGWSQRRKSSYFFQYERVAARFAREFGFSQWIIDAYFNVCTRVDISRSRGLDCLAAVIEETLIDIRANYTTLGATENPFVVVKADAGTYGMGVIMLDAAEQVLSLNRRQRNTLTRIKDGMTVTDIIVQEGVPTIAQIDNAAAEEILCSIGDQIIGSFWRLNERKSERENLNSSGMRFAPSDAVANPRLQHASKTVARLALLAAAREFASDLSRP